MSSSFISSKSNPTTGFRGYLNLAVVLATPTSLKRRRLNYLE